MTVDDDTLFHLLDFGGHTVWQWTGRRVPHALCRFVNVNSMALMRLVVHGLEPPLDIPPGDVIDGVEKLVAAIEKGQIQMKRVIPEDA